MMINRSLALLIVLCFLPTAEGASPLRVMSFNIRYGSASDGENRWELRREFVVDTIKDFGPDLLGTQETLGFQARYLQQELEGYAYFGRSRMTTPDEQCGILYRKARFTRLAGGHFWLSESPDTPASKSWDSSLPRIATWVLLDDHEGDAPVLLLNTHFDHVGAVAREKSAGLIAARLLLLKAYADDAHVIVTGDFNVDEGTPPYRALTSESAGLTDVYRQVHPNRAEDEGTFTDFKFNQTRGRRIDWILVSDSLGAASSQIVRASRKQRYPSDHFPVTAVLEPRP